MTIKKLAVGFLMYVLFCNLNFASNEVKSDNLNQTPQSIKDAGNQAEFSKEMDGDMSSYWKTLGALAQDDGNARTIFDALTNDKTRSQAPNTIHIGMLPLPFSKNEFLGWVYWESTPDKKPVRLKKYELQKWLNPQVSFGIFSQYKKNGLDTFGLKKKLKPILNLKLGDNEELASFDFAPYELGELGRAIGMRITIHSCGAGGNLCSNEDLRLFSLKSPAIEEVFHSPIGFFGVYSGDWHPDHTRDHFTEELPGILVLKPQNNSPIPRLQVKALFRKKWIVKEFSLEKNAQGRRFYKTHDAEIFPLVEQMESFQDLDEKIKKGKIHVLKTD